MKRVSLPRGLPVACWRRGVAESAPAEVITLGQHAAAWWQTRVSSVVHQVR